MGITTGPDSENRERVNMGRRPRIYHYCAVCGEKTGESSSYVCDSCKVDPKVATCQNNFRRGLMNLVAQTVSVKCGVCGAKLQTKIKLIQTPHGYMFDDLTNSFWTGTKCPNEKQGIHLLEPVIYGHNDFYTPVFGQIVQELTQKATLKKQRAIATKAIKKLTMQKMTGKKPLPQNIVDSYREEQEQKKQRATYLETHE